MGPLRRSAAGAFTLLEVVIALAVMAILSGTIFSIVRGSIQATADIEVLERERRQIRAFIEQCRRVFHTFPPGASLELRAIERDPLLQELVMRGYPGAFVFGPDPIFPRGETTIAVRRRPRDEASPPTDGDSDVLAEAFYLGISKPDLVPLPKDGAPEETELALSQALEPDEQGRYWLEIIPEVTALNWRFWDPGKKAWFDARPLSRPPLVEMNLVPRDSQTPIRVVFEIY